MSNRKNTTFTVVYQGLATGITPVDAAVLTEVAAAGFGGICLRLTDDGPICLDTPEADLQRIAADAEEAGLTLILSCDRDGLTDITASDEAQRAAGIETVISLLDLAARLGASNLVIEPVRRTDQAAKPAGETYADIAARALDALLALRFEAELRGVVLSCRVISNGLLQSPIEARDFVDRISLPFVGLGIDACGDVWSDLAEYIRILTHRVSYVHIGTGAFPCDSAKEIAPSENDINIVRALHDVGFDASLTVSAGAHPDDAMKYLRSVMTAIGQFD